VRAATLLTLPLEPFAWATRRVRTRFRDWWQARMPRTDTLLLTQRNVYILPTRAGFLFAATLLLLLVGSINYQLSLGYLLTFVLAGSGVVSMHLTHATLRGLTLHLCSSRRAPRAGASACVSNRHPRPPSAGPTSPRADRPTCG
jgi:hypothetical protein